MMKVGVLICILATWTLISSCPASQMIYPCTCSEENIYCKGLENDQALLDVAFALRNYKKFSSFNVEDSHFMFIPHDVFKFVDFQKLRIAKSTFVALSDTDTAFEGIEDHLTSLTITDSEMYSVWDWEIFKHLKNLVQLHVSVGVTSVSEDIKYIPSLRLRDLSLAKNNIGYIHDTAFAGFKELECVDLRKNLIPEVKRSMFPNPAGLLSKLDLGHNEIEDLPTDLFENMPRLRTLIIESNKLLTLNEQTFKPVWSQLTHFDAMDNHLRCDCRLLWIMQYKFPHIFTAVCDKPANLTWKKLKELSEKDLWCYYTK